MLRFLSIQNFALIDRLEVEFEPGLNLITGETGSGKSILVDAVGLLVGERASQSKIRQGCQRARVEGIFEVEADHPVLNLLSEGQIPLENNQVIVRREITLSGSNKVFINDLLSTQRLLSNLGLLLSDIHGQHDQQQLLHLSAQRDFLDAYLEEPALVEQVRASFREWKSVRTQLEGMRTSEQERLQRLDTLRYQLEDLKKLDLRPGLDTELETEKKLLASAEERFRNSEESFQVLYNQEVSALSLIGRAEKRLQELSLLDQQMGDWAEKLKETRFAVEEVAYRMRDYARQVQLDPNRLEDLETRLAELQKAFRKYGGSVEQLLGYIDRVEQEIEKLSRAETHSQELALREEKLGNHYMDLARRLSAARNRQSKHLSRRMERELADLNMGAAVFRVEVTQSEVEPNQRGIDQVEFRISPNRGESPGPLNQIASGGELSRVVLALKSILTLEDYGKTLVFDEVDTGIGGRVASSVGERLARLAHRHQVFCVTHLPQIACYATQHFHVDKQEKGNRTRITLARLDEKGRVEEMAHMMAGPAATETTYQQARELLEHARRSAEEPTQVATEP